MLITPWPSLRQALFRRLRSNLVLQARLPGDWTESAAPTGTAFPHGILSLHYSPTDYDWSGFVVTVGFDAVVFGKLNMVDSAELDQLAFSTLQDAALDPAGQTSILCRRLSSISLEDADETGQTVYVAGGVYEAKVTQNFPANRTIRITADSDIS